LNRAVDGGQRLVVAPIGFGSLTLEAPGEIFDGRLSQPADYGTR
jgi:hypothetical protein